MEVSGSAVQNVADVSVLQKHLRKLVPLLLEDGGEATAVLEAALEEKGAVEHMRKFLSDPQVHTVLVERSTLKGEARARARRHHSIAKWRLCERARDGGGCGAVLFGAEEPGRAGRWLLPPCPSSLPRPESAALCLPQRAPERRWRCCVSGPCPGCLPPAAGLPCSERRDGAEAALTGLRRA